MTPLIPAPNVNLPQGNVELLTPLPTKYDQQTYRVDEDLGPKDRVFGRFSSYNYTDTVQAGLTPIADILDDFRNWSYEASYTHIFSPTVVNQFRWGYLNALPGSEEYVIPDCQFFKQQFEQRRRCSERSLV